MDDTSEPPAAPTHPAAPPNEPPTGPPGAATTEHRRLPALGARVAGLRRTRWWRWGRWPLLAGVAVAAAAVAGFAVLYVTVDLPDDPPTLHSSVILDAGGEEIAVLQQDGLRAPVDLDDVAPVVIDALIAAEDRRFYGHDGLDPIGIARAFVSNLRSGETRQGGSTLTQQLVKNSYLDAERTLTRKVKEAVLAIKLERRADKADILERYLNTVYFGRGAYGIEAAASTYFGTSAGELELHEAALLVGLLRAPEAADPARDPDAARQRRSVVLGAMAATGTITRDEAGVADRRPLGTAEPPSSMTLTAGVAPHFVEWIRAEAIERYGAEVVYGGGLRITTTLDLGHQRAAEMSVATVLDQPDDPQAGIVALDASGAIRAYVGGRDFDALQVDLVRGREGGGSGRQPGSTFKPFVLAAALEEGIGLGTAYPAPAETTIDTPEGPYQVANYGGSGYGQLDLLAATARSVNTTYARLAQDVGPQAVVDVASRLGIASELAPNASLALGTSEVSVLELAGAYLTLAREGNHVEPWAIARVEDGRGRILFDAGMPEGEQVLGEEPARAVTYALEQVLARGTGTAARIERPAAGKTGTTQGHGDAWFAGYTPGYTAVVWMGYPEGPARPMSDVRGGPVTGGGLPAQIWRAFMEAALDGVEPASFAPPPDELLRGGRARPHELVREGGPVPTEAVAAEAEDPGPPPQADDAPSSEPDGAGSSTTSSTTTTTAAPTTTTTSTTTTTTSTTSSTTTTTTTEPPDPPAD